MDVTAIEEEKEIQLLKLKCNKLLDMIEEKNTEIIKKDNEILNLKKRISNLEEKNESDTVSIDDKKESPDELILIARAIKKVIKAAVTEDAFIKYTRASKYSEQYCKIEKNTFEKIISSAIEMDVKTFIEYCAKFKFLKARHKLNCVFNSDDLRIYYVNRVLVELWGGSEEAKEG